jgi:hypothetical protein
VFTGTRAWGARAYRHQPQSCAVVRLNEFKALALMSLLLLLLVWSVVAAVAAVAAVALMAQTRPPLRVRLASIATQSRSDVATVRDAANAARRRALSGEPCVPPDVSQWR